MRHKISTEPISISGETLSTELQNAENLEAHGQWFTAGEAYWSLATTLKPQQPLAREAAGAFARSATCFELSGQKRAAARAYFEAASILHNNKIAFQAAGELFNRAAFNFKAVSEFFNAGDSYRRAAIAFSEVKADTIHSLDNIPPVPAGAGKYTVAAYCYTAGADAFLHSDAAWARATYWEAGKMHLRQGTGYHAYVAFRKALVVCIQFDQTHAGDQLRKALPMSNEERKRKVDPIKILEEAAFQGHQGHYEINRGVLNPDWAQAMTDKDMISCFHEFYLEFTKIGNHSEASRYYVMEKQRHQKALWPEGKYIPAIGYFLWGLTCGYGESLLRWLLVCLSILMAFSLIYAYFDLIGPVTHWVDYVYFSVVTFTDFGHTDVLPGSPIGKLLAGFEIFLGLIMLAMLLTYVSRRIFR